MAAEGLARFDLVTLNKVLEHVVDPVAMLARAGDHVAPGGAVYVELPDGEVATPLGPGREEFGLEHYHAFSMTSMCLMASRAGLVVRNAARLREPSTKVTLYAFLERP
jgi:2-polyprenyl-3-methyl-5-hydroxy-6-metoxy-1,4-benzoquinol methylase